MSGAVEPPRGLVLLAAVWIAVSWLVSFGLRMPLQISAGALTPGVRSMLICCTLGALVAWPMLRLCQTPPPAPVRSTLLDAVTLIVLLQTVLWPLRLATTWAPERTALVDAALVAHVLACCGIVTAALPWRSATVRGLAMAGCLLVAAGPPSVLAAGGLGEVAGAMPRWIGGGFPWIGDAMRATSSLPEADVWRDAWIALASGILLAAAGAVAAAVAGGTASRGSRLRTGSGADTVRGT
ncbi:MAG: hypothetical protein FGM37_08685 [Phycisphaerales bacterium]|nr:hypothetical protein [Phycisphaerales bacterium]